MADQNISDENDKYPSVIKKTPKPAPKKKLVLKLAEQKESPPPVANYLTKNFKADVYRGGALHLQTSSKEAAALLFYAKGGNKAALEILVEKASVPDSDKRFLEEVIKIVDMLEKANPGLSENLKSLNKNPDQIEIAEEEITDKKFDDQKIVFNRSGEGELLLGDENFETDAEYYRQVVSNLVLEEKLNYARQKAGLPQYSPTQTIYSQAPSTISAPPSISREPRPTGVPKSVIVTPHKPSSIASSASRQEVSGGSSRAGWRLVANGIGSAAGKATKVLLAELGPIVEEAGRVVQKTVSSILEDPVGFAKRWGKRIISGILFIGGLIFAYTLAFLSWLILNIIVSIFIIVGIVALILFIINSGAYIVPPGGLGGGGGITPGVLPASCPSIWPVNPSPAKPVTQGPNSFCTLDADTTIPGLQVASHCGLEAIDIGVANEVVYATHTGSLQSFWDECTGWTIVITSTCNNRDITSLYGHLETINQPDGLVNQGDPIAISGNTTGTGNCTTGAHLHYGFRSNSAIMAFPLIPESITPRGCCGACSVPPFEYCITDVP